MPLPSEKNVRRTMVCLVSIILTFGVAVVGVFGWTIAPDCVDAGWVVFARGVNCVFCTLLEVLVVLHLIMGLRIELRGDEDARID